ncbi:hypothetical protein AX16_006455 [Volvariella volvacea WC 439]|nr:hypothetical protein AX16_006455 [Volvariella volvacea WC 439]
MSDSSLELYVALSCLNVGVGPGGTTSMVARVALVNYRGIVILDRFVKPTITVRFHDQVDSTHLSLTGGVDVALPFNAVQQEIANQLKGKILVGHCLWNDLSGTKQFLMWPGRRTSDRWVLIQCLEYRILLSILATLPSIPKLTPHAAHNHRFADIGLAVSTPALPARASASSRECASSDGSVPFGGQRLGRVRLQAELALCTPTKHIFSLLFVTLA